MCTNVLAGAAFDGTQVKFPECAAVVCTINSSENLLSDGLCNASQLKLQTHAGINGNSPKSIVTLTPRCES